MLFFKPLIMKLFTASAALLTVLESRSVLGAAVKATRAQVKDVTLDIVNTNLAPDGFMRSMLMSMVVIVRC